MTQRFKLIRPFILCLCCLLPNIGLHARVEGDSNVAEQKEPGLQVLSAFHARLRDPNRLAKNQGFLFDGVVDRNDTIHQRRCTSGVERKIAYRVDQMLWDYPDSVLRQGYVVGKDFIDCRQPSLPNWDTGTRVLVYCEGLDGQGYDCLGPVRFTDDRLSRVKQWIAELQEREGNPELTKMHYLLRDSLELAPTRPLLLVGRVTGLMLQPKTLVQRISILVPPTMRVSIARVLWGYYKETEVIGLCPHRDCSGFTVGANVIAYCQATDAYRHPPATCPLVSLTSDEENVHRAERWAGQARDRQRALIVEKISKSLAALHPDSRSEPMVYRGHATWVGKEDNGITPLVHFVDTTGQFKQEINLRINRFYATDVSIPVDVGKPMITFCVQRDDICSNGDLTTAIIEDSDETFGAIKQLIETAP